MQQPRCLLAGAAHRIVDDPGLYWYLLERIGVTRVNTLMFLVPPVTTVWGAVMFGEPFTFTTAIGLSLALIATWLVARAPSEVVPRG